MRKQEARRTKGTSGTCQRYYDEANRELLFIRALSIERQSGGAMQTSKVHLYVTNRYRVPTLAHLLKKKRGRQFPATKSPQRLDFPAPPYGKQYMRLRRKDIQSARRANEAIPFHLVRISFQKPVSPRIWHQIVRCGICIFIKNCPPLIRQQKSWPASTLLTARSS